MTVVQLWVDQKFPSAQQEVRGYTVSLSSVHVFVFQAATVSIGGSPRDPAQ